ncbi:MAG: gliding motility-associated C-terminal domain-containing protein [Flavobacteriia bacterium]|nr:gliding motility-associated C-terminal domain-containing protein [Flavobacteriia bacterium]
MQYEVRHIFIILLVLTFKISVHSQVNMGNSGSSSGCSGVFFDQGGAGDYSNNLNQTYTLCSDIPGEHVQIDFSAFNLEAFGDFLTIYNGNSTAAPIIGTYTGGTNPGYVQGNNASGCLTFVFTSNGAITASGWEATISCGLPCQTIIADVSTGPIDADGIVSICGGDNVIFNGVGIYPQNNTTYNQSDATSTFEWTFGDGTIATGQTVINSFAGPGIFDVNLTITDVNGCVSTNDINIVVQVPDIPDFTGTLPENTVICLGDSNVLNGMVDPTQINLVIPPIVGTFNIPDASGALNSSNQINEFNPGATFTNANNLNSICVDLEHSNLGNIEITLICPNGQSVILKSFGAGGAGLYLGNPIDNAPSVGSGFQYCFSMSGATSLVSGSTVISGNPPGNSIEAGTYLPSGNFSSLVGCPLNGPWTIQINDNLGGDDGNLFGWNIEFNQSTLPPGSIYIPNIESSGWLPDPTIITNSGGQIVVVPTSPGTACYNFQAIDEFGCPYVQEVCFIVLAPGEGGCPDCLITNFTANSTIAPCSDQYTTTGVIEFTEAPNSGSLIVEDCQGNSVVADTYPFNSPVGYTLIGTNADGQACEFKAYFSSDTSCQQIIPFTYPIAFPGDESGTVTPSMEGYSTHSFVLCNSDIFHANSNDDWIVPVIPPNNDPGIGYLVYKCSPTINGQGIDPFSDPCYVTTLTTEDISLINNGGNADPFLMSLGLLTNNTFYIVPMSFYSVSNSIINSNCYDLDFSQEMIIQYLNPISYTSSQDCYAGTVSVTIAGGGYPEFYGGIYTASNIQPITATFINTTSNIGGTIGIQGLTNGQNWSFDIVDGNSCPITISGIFNGPEDASFSFSQAGYCVTATNPTPILTGVPGGVFTSSAGLAINGITGEVDISNSLPGTYNVVYTSPALVCPGIDSVELTISENPVIIAGVDQVVCEGTLVTLSGAGADFYVWDNGVIDGVPFNSPIGVMNYNVIGTNQYGCSGNASVLITTNAGPIVNAGIDQVHCQGETSVLNASGDLGLNYSWNNGVIDGNPFISPVGSTNYTLVGMDPVSGCSSSDVVNILINPTPNINAGPNIGICINESVTLTATGASSYVWTNGVQNGVVFVPDTTMTYSVIGTLLGCVGASQVTVTVFEHSVINAGIDQSICIGASAILTAFGCEMYTWDNSLGIGNNFEVFPNVSTLYSVSGIDTNGCPGSDTIQVFVNSLPVVDAGPNQIVCFGTSVILTGSGTSNYLWNDGIVNSIPFIPAVGPHTYVVEGTDSNGCQNTDQVMVFVNPLPLLNAGVDQTICEGDSVQVSGFGAMFINWDNGISNNTFFTPTETTIYTLTGTDANGCVNTDQLIVNVNALPNVSGGPDLILCLGNAVTLSGSGANIYSWDNGISNGVQFNPVLGTSVYTLTGTDLNGCVNTDQLTITVNPIPNPIISVPAEYCIGFSASLSTTQNFSSYLWSNGANTPVTNATISDNPIAVTVSNVFGCTASTGGFLVIENPNVVNNLTIEICQGDSVLIHGVFESVTGVYTQMYNTSKGCDSLVNCSLIVHQLPNVNAGNDIHICTPNEIILAASGAVTYSWSNGVSNGVPFNQNIGTVNYSVIGTSSFGCENVDSVKVTVNPLPIIQIQNDTSICFGNSVTLTASGAQNYMWDFGVINGISFTPMFSNLYTVVGTDSNGCQNSEQIAININPLPIVDGGLISSVCQGGQVILTASGAISFTWDQGVINGVPFTPPNGTTFYTVTGVDANGCSNSDQAIVTVYPLPIVEAGPDLELCFGEQAVLTATGASSYSWTNNVQNGVAFTPSLGVTNYTVTGISVNNCVNSDQLAITVNSIPIMNAGLNDTVCVGEFVTLSGSGGDTYSWNNNVINGASFAPPVGTNVYTLTGIDSNGCTNAAQVIVVVNPLPNVNAGANQVVCVGASITLTATGASSYIWSNNVVDGVPFTPVQSATYTVTGTSQYGCVASDQVTIGVETIPSISFSPNVTFGCSPLTVTFVNHSQNVVDCNWTFSDGTSVSGCDTIFHTFVSNSGVQCFDVTLTSSTVNHCVGVSSVSDLICVESSPIAGFTQSQSTMLNYNTTCAFTNTSMDASSYLWLFGDGNNSFETNVSHTYSADEFTDYLITLIAFSPSGCTDTAISNVSVVEQLLYYVPNTFTPNGDDKNQTFQPVFTSGIDVYEFTLLIFNRWGEIIFESHDAAKGWDGRYGENEEFVQDDVYVWKIYFKEKNNDIRHTKVGHVNVLR